MSGGPSDQIAQMRITMTTNPPRKAVREDPSGDFFGKLRRHGWNLFAACIAIACHVAAIDARIPGREQEPGWRSPPGTGT
jgi:hypothetical protein